MDDAAKRVAEELTEKAVADSPFVDFRDNYRERLRWLKENQPTAFATALSHYNDVLVPNIANGSEPLREWIEYGKRLGQLSGQGRSMRIDETGRAFDLNGELSGLLLHIPDDTSVPALALAVPRDPSAPQQATLDLLVRKS